MIDMKSPFERFVLLASIGSFLVLAPLKSASAQFLIEHPTAHEPDAPSEVTNPELAYDFVEGEDEVEPRDGHQLTSAQVDTEMTSGVVVTYRSIFNTDKRFINNIIIHALYTASAGNLANQWEIEFSVDRGDTWPWTESADATFLIVSGGAQGTPTEAPSVDITAALTAEEDPPRLSNLRIRVNTNPLTSTGETLEIYDIWVTADFDTTKGGPSPLTFVTTTLPDGAEGTPYGPEIIDVEGGNKTAAGCAGYTYEIVNGELPPGLSLGTTGTDPDAEISGTPTQKGVYGFTLQVQDCSFPAQVEQQYFEITIPGLGILPATLAPAIAEQAYGPQVITTTPGATSPFYWCVAGTLPSGMQLQYDTDGDGTGDGDVNACPAGGGYPAVDDANKAVQLILGGTPDQASFRSFIIRLQDSSPETAEKTYLLRVLASGVTLQPKTLKQYLKGVAYVKSPSAADELQADFLTATDIDNKETDTGSVTLTFPGGNPGTITNDPTEFDYVTDGALDIYVVGDVTMTSAAGAHPFTVTIKDPNNPVQDNDARNYTLQVAERQTLLNQAPPANAKLQTGVLINYAPANETGLKVGDLLTRTRPTDPDPDATAVTAKVVSFSPGPDPGGLDQLVVADDNPDRWAGGDIIEGPGAVFSATISSSQKIAYLPFTVFASGGAPSTIPTPPTPEYVDRASVPHYNYKYQVIPVGDSPALKTSIGDFPLIDTGDDPVPTTTPLTDAIRFIDSDNLPVTGAYDVKFWAMDVLSRLNPPDGPDYHPEGDDGKDDYEFVPVTVRVNVVPALEKDATRPIKLRQEQFR